MMLTVCRLVAEVGEIQDSMSLLNNKLREAETSHQVIFYRAVPYIRTPCPNFVILGLRIL